MLLSQNLLEYEVAEPTEFGPALRVFQKWHFWSKYWKYLALFGNVWFLCKCCIVALKMSNSGLPKCNSSTPLDMVITRSSKKPTKWRKNAEQHARTFWQRGSLLREKFQKHLWQMIADVIRYLHPNAKFFWPEWAHSNIYHLEIKFLKCSYFYVATKQAMNVLVLILTCILPPIFRATSIEPNLWTFSPLL